MDDKKMSNLKPIVSITEMCQLVQMSRGRFYQLLYIGFFPKPLHDERSNRPYYNEELQQVCIEARRTGIGVDGSYILFYSSRKIKNKTQKKTQNRKNKVDPIIEDYKETLESMRLVVSSMQIKEALAKIYPDGFEAIEDGLIIRELFRFLKFEV